MGGRGSSSGKAGREASGNREIVFSPTSFDETSRKLSQAASLKEKNKPKSRFAGQKEKKAQKQATNQQTETKKEILNRYNTFSEKQAERLSKMPKTGEKIKLEFAAFVKEQTGIDITKAITKYGNNRSNFSIDFRKLTESKSENANMQALNRIKTLKSSNFDFNVMSNGAYTYLIGVENKRHKKK